MGSSKEKKPYSDVLKAQLSNKLFQAGTAAKNQVGADYLKDLQRKDTGVAATAETVNRELAKRKLPKNRGKNIAKASIQSIDQLGAGISAATTSGVQRTQRTMQTAGNNMLQSASNMMGSLQAASISEQITNRDKWERGNALTQAGLDVLSAGVAYGGMKYDEHKQKTAKKGAHKTGRKGQAADMKHLMDEMRMGG